MLIGLNAPANAPMFDADGFADTAMLQAQQPSSPPTSTAPASPMSAEQLDAQKTTEVARAKLQAAEKNLAVETAKPLDKGGPSEIAKNTAQLRAAQSLTQVALLDYENALHAELSVARQAVPAAAFDQYVQKMELREQTAASTSGDPKTQKQAFESAKKLEAAASTVATLESVVQSTPDKLQTYYNAALVAARTALSDIQRSNFERHFDIATEATMATGDPKQMNRVDTFRQGLTVKEQKVYDDNLAALRKDKRINYVPVTGKAVTLVEKELAVRGILTASFGTPKLREQAIDDAAKTANKTFDIFFEGASFDLGNYGYAPGSTSGGLFTASSGQDIVISRDFLMNYARANDNAFVHEFSHAMQKDFNTGSYFPSSFSAADEAEFKQVFETPAVKSFLDAMEKNSTWGGEAFPTIQNFFRQRPTDLQRASPELYEFMVKKMGIDPMQGIQV
jgi:hypothetical protein